MREYPKAWIEALRSGKYQQAQGQLRAGSKFCCLGVRCDVNDSGMWLGDTYEGNSGVIPVSLHKKDGFESEDRKIVLPFESRNAAIESLTTLNDWGFSFSQIADVIECFWEVL